MSPTEKRPYIVRDSRNLFLQFPQTARKPRLVPKLELASRYRTKEDANAVIEEFDLPAEALWIVESKET